MVAGVGSSAMSALMEARELKRHMPVPTAKRHGDREGADWWDSHMELFAKAQREYGQLHSDVYSLVSDPNLRRSFGESFVDKSILAPLSLFQGNGFAKRQFLSATRWLKADVTRALIAGTSEAMRSVLREMCHDSCGLKVYALDLFTDEFCDLLLAELDHLEFSGIPLRRPNGMNRYGAILSHLGFQETLLEPLMRYVVLPFSRELWPEWCAASDCDETYGFVVRYRLGEDVDLTEHADTSNVTLNACLGRDFFGGELYFKGVRFTDSANDSEPRSVFHRKGVALLHLGGHFHGAYPITSGERSNLVLWSSGTGGTVRIRPGTPR
eukprot:TRINITY_DN62426_c0_g1_i1.p1 TRINITY_DN62426_c0_g1~~TRINITY_DN62426_c0_g1_i1.p1  ORF type:complete len:379 (-),score=64.43 TRINITY_DN62426_c0_g1_i1:93-1067(-)